MSRCTPRLWATFAIIEVTFKFLVTPAYIASTGRSVAELAPTVGCVAVVVVAVFFGTVWLLMRQADRLVDDRSDAGIRELGSRLQRLPQWITILWTIEWVTFVAVSTIATGTWDHAALPIAMFGSTMVFAPLPLGYLVSVWVLSPVVTKVSLEARDRGISPDAPSLRLRHQMVLFALCVTLAPTTYMASIAFAARIEMVPISDMWIQVVLFTSAVILYAVMTAAFFATAVSSPIVQMTKIVQSIAQSGDASNVERLPETRRDEIGELSQWTNVMIDRLEQIESERTQLTRTLEDRVDDRTRHLEQANDARLKAELELRQAQRLEAVGRLAAGIAHEINTPIQFVSNNCEFAQQALVDLLGLVGHYRNELSSSSPGAAMRAAKLEDDIDLDYLTSNLPTALDQAVMGLRRVSTIVKSMRRFAHDDQRGMVPVDINEALESTLVVTRHEYKDIAELVTNFATLPTVLCHPGELNQAFLNIIVNAAHAIASVVGETGARGKLVVHTRLDGNAVQVAISDTGGGIPEHARDRIFDPFFTTKEVGKGTGQGLSIARAVLHELHDGDLRFETATGTGTTFYIRLPIDGGARALVARRDARSDAERDVVGVAA